MFALLGLILTLGLTALGFTQARSFVRRRLRWVNAVKGPGAPLVAGVAAALLAAPVTWLLPLVGGGTAFLFGVGVGAGVAAGARDTSRPWLNPGPE